MKNSKLKILLGGVPLGCDNIGDEAIVGCVVELLRRLVPDPGITVCTRDRKGTAARLDVEAAPLYGFGSDPDLRGFADQLRHHDVYIWFGATGLSDYPETALRLLKTARRSGVPSIVWGVGMNSELNPAFYRASGKRRKLLDALSPWHTPDLTAAYEKFLRRRTERHIRRELSACALVMLRDAPSLDEVRACGVTNAEVGADTAILQTAAAAPPLPEMPDAARIGFCVSEQSVVSDLDGVVKLWDELLTAPDRRLMLIPMNPVTDKRLMLQLAVRSRHPERIECFESSDPADVQACAAQCRVLVSSRLHLLILGANAGTPGIGIERGSKIANWLANFGESPAGNVENCDFSGIARRIDAVLRRPDAEVRAEVSQVMAAMRRRLDAAAEKLRIVLTAIRDPSAAPHRR